MSIFSNPSFDQHEQVLFVSDKASGLKAIIAIHNTTMGPAVGGCRMWPYQNDTDALTDVLRLSRGMTFKNALAGLPFGGGKAVIIGDPNTDKSEATFHAFAQALNTLNGQYLTAEDVGITPSDMMITHQQSPHVMGLEGKSGDPSPFTALGTFLGIKAALQHQRQSTDLNGIKVAVQGLGHVGYHLCRHLHQAGAQLVICDLNPVQRQRAQQEFNAEVVELDAIYHQPVDVYAPCALGGTLNEVTIPLLQASIVAGCANNQLARAEHGLLLQERGILYAPDYVINAGGIINVSFEHHYDAQQSEQKVRQIEHTLLKIFAEAKRSGETTERVADRMALAIIERQSAGHNAIIHPQSA
ncbi:MAG: Glu/Leu/Phe/Val dehydrogenase dimerization domain-containing protein [Ferrimonas sp.]